MMATTTTDRPLEGKRILILEDDYYSASDEKALLQDAGATVVGPFGSGAQESDIPAAGEVDGAVVDINLGNGPNFDLARTLAAREIPLVSVTVYAPAVIPEELSYAPRVEKPLRQRDLISTLAGLMARS